MSSVKGRYELIDVLGEGGMGVVYRALDQQMGREVAVKTIRDSMDRSVLDLFRRECAVLSSLNHPNIVDIYDVGEFGEDGAKKPYFVMPLLPGAPLSSLLTSQTQRLTPERVVDIMTQALKGLQAAHEKGLIHRDLKPSNIFVLDDDSVKIIDFGVAHLVNNHSTVGLKGTLYYMAPEQLELQPPTALSDIFAMGVVCYEVLTRRRPFVGATNEELVTAIRKLIPPSASELNPAVSAPLSQIVHAAMAKHPWHRFSSAREFADSLQKAIHNQAIERFDPAKLEARLLRAKLALAESEYEFAGEILTEMESEGHVHPGIRPLRKQIDQANRNKTIRQLLDSAERRLKDDEYQLALEKIQQIIQLDPSHPDALRMKASIEAKRSSQQIDNWLRLASDHLDNFSFNHARQALQKLMQLKPGDTRALQLLESIDRKEQTYLSIKREKEQHYQAALESWRQGEVSSALGQMELLMMLDREAPERSDVDKAAAYQDMFNKVRSEHEALRDAYDEAKKNLDDGHFGAGLAICDKYLETYPNHVLFQSLKLDLGEAQRQALSAFIARMDREVQAEPDLDRKVGMLEEALAKHPKENHFEQALKTVSARREQINAIVARARNLEDRGQYTEALNQWEMLRTIYRQYPGIEFEIERVQRRRNQQASADRKTRIIEQADAALKCCDFGPALRIILSARAEFPDDTELAPMEKLARAGIHRLCKAEELIFQGKKLLEESQFDDGLQLLENANVIAERNQYVRAVLLDSLLNRASATVHTDLEKAEALVQRCLALDNANAQARSLRLLIADRKREASVHNALSRARQLQADGQVNLAAAEVTRALTAYPDEPRLLQLRQTLQQVLGESNRPEEPSKQIEPPMLARQEAPKPEAGKQEQPRQERERTPQPTSEPGFDATRLLQSSPPVLRAEVAAHNAGSAAAAASPSFDRLVADSSPRLVIPSPFDPAPVPAKAPGKSLFRLGAIAAGIVLIIAAIAVTQFRKKPQPPTAGPATLVPVVFKSNVPSAHLTLDGIPLTVSNESLKPGKHTLQASSDGYLPATKVFTVASGQTDSLPVNVDLLPAPTELRIASDLTAGRLLLDGISTDLTSGGVVKSDIAPGRHTVKVTEGTQEFVSFGFIATPGAMPQVEGAVTAKTIPAFVISSLSATGKLWSSAGLKGGTSESAIQPIAAEGVSLPGLASSSSFFIEDGKAPRRSVPLQPTSVPSLFLELGAKPQTGTIIVRSNIPDAIVVISGQALKQPMSKGIRVLNLQPQLYQIKIMHDNYMEVAEQPVDLKKGEIKTVNFELVPTVHTGSLALERFPPDTEVLLDGSPFGRTDGEGNLNKQLAPGNHTITLHKAGYDALVIKREIKADLTVAIAGETVMPGLAAVTFKTTPENAKLTYWREGSDQKFEAGSSQTLNLRPGDYQVSAEAEHYNAKLLQFVVQPGKASTVELALSAETVKPVSSRTLATTFQDPGQWKSTNEWWIHNAAGPGWFLRNSGDFTVSFLKQSAKAFFKSKTKRIQWVVDSQPNGDGITYTLDDHVLLREVKTGLTITAAKERHNLDGTDQFTVKIDISPERIVIRGGGQTLDEYKRPNPELPLGRFGVKGEVVLSVLGIR